MIKANELMTGDWVNIYVFPNENPQIEDLFPARIGTIMTPLPSENSGEHIECIFKAKDGGIGCAARPVETCLPIPLTADILKKNGFEHRIIDCAEFYYIAEDYYDITISEWSDSIWLVRYDCTEINTPHEQITSSYVHQLQNFLRLCGLNDLADNFKV